MPDSAAFDAACEALEQASPLNRLEARGTMRIALKGAGLDPRSVARDQMLVVIDRMLPDHLESRGVCASVGAELRARVQALAAEAGGDTSPEAVFERLGG